MHSVEKYLKLNISKVKRGGGNFLYKFYCIMLVTDSITYSARFLRIVCFLLLSPLSIIKLSTSDAFYANGTTRIRDKIKPHNICVKSQQTILKTAKIKKFLYFLSFNCVFYNCLYIREAS